VEDKLLKETGTGRKEDEDPPGSICNDGCTIIENGEKEEGSDYCGPSWLPPLMAERVA